MGNCYDDSMELNVLQDVSSNAITLGALDTKACVLYLNCSRKEFARDYITFQQTKKPLGYVRVFFHELTHYFQLNTTPVGMYINCLEDLQVIQVSNIIKVLKKYSLPIPNEPLIHLLATYYSYEMIPEAWYFLRKWYAAELLKNLFSGDFQKYTILSKNTVFADEELSDIFCEINYEMSKTLNFDMNPQKISNKKPHFPEDIQNAINENASPFENHARMAEYWWDGKDGASTFFSKRQDIYKYTAWIKAFAIRNEVDNFQDFCLSFMAISELSLFSPVLPGIDEIQECSIYDFLPVYRMAKLIEVSPCVKPINGLQDYNRYINDLCERAKFTPVNGLCEQIINMRKPKSGVYFWGDLFYKSIYMRKEDFSIFSNYNLWHFSAEGTDLRYKTFLETFTPPVICYNDVVYSRNCTAGEREAFSIIARNVFRKYIFELMTGFDAQKDGTIKIALPVHGTEIDKFLIAQAASRLIVRHLGILPRLELI